MGELEAQLQQLGAEEARLEAEMMALAEERGDAPVNAAPVEQEGLGVDLDEFSEDEEDEPEPMEASADEGGRDISIGDLKISLDFLDGKSLVHFVEMGEEDLLIKMAEKSLPLASRNWILDKIKGWKQGGDRQTMAEESIDDAKRELNMVYKPIRPKLTQ